MAEQDYREKIKKLLALSESSNEHEAKSALLKAKKLMAEHKIAEIDLKDIDKKKVIHTTTEFRCSKRREAWMIGLATTIAEIFVVSLTGLKFTINSCLLFALWDSRMILRHARKFSNMQLIAFEMALQI